MALAMKAETVRRRPDQGPGDRLRALASRVSRLAVAGRLDPEHVVVEKLTVAAEMRRLAREIEGGR